MANGINPCGYCRDKTNYLIKKEEEETHKKVQIRQIKWNKME